MSLHSSNFLEQIDTSDLSLILACHGFIPDSVQNDERWTVFVDGTDSKRKPIYKVSNGHRRGGLYASCAWEHLGSGATGYGCVSLGARLLGLSERVEDRKRVLSSIASVLGFGFLQLDEANCNGFVEICEPQDDMTFDVMNEYTPEALRSIGCDVVRVYAEQDGERIALSSEGGAVYSYSFGPSFGKYSEEDNWSPLVLAQDFNLYQLRSYTTKGFMQGGKKVSLRRTAHELFPIFAFVYEHVDKNGRTFQWGQIIQPEWDSSKSKEERSSFFFYTGGLTAYKVNKTLMGDEVANRVFGGMFVEKSVKEANTGEPLTLKKIVQTEEEEEEIDLKEEEVRVNNVVLCKDGLNAVNAYYRLNALKHTHPCRPGLNELFYHVCWMVKPNDDFSTYAFSLLNKFAKNLYLMLDIDNQGKMRSFNICKRFTRFRMAFLPERLRSCPSFYEGGKSVPCCDIRSFFLSYELTEEEKYAFEGDKGLLFLSCFSAALPIEPLVRCEKRDKKTNKLIEYFYKVDSSCLWQFMATVGYCREVDKESSDRVGRFLRIKGHEVTELDITSLLSEAINELKDFAKRIASPGTEDYRKMCNAVNGSREITEKTVVNLPELETNYRDGYGPELDHFFYQNGALRITPDEIRFIPYSEICFNVNAAQKLPFDFFMPCSKDEIPFRIFENPEYAERVKELETHRKEVEKYSMKAVEREEQELQVWAQRNRWLFEFKDEEVSRWWEPLQVLRCFANEEYEKEEELLRKGERFDEGDYRSLYGHLANILYALGRPLFRYRGGGTNYIPYITENGVSKEGRSEGGSGKSVFVNTFMACAGKVLPINSRNLKIDSDISLQLANYVHHSHRVIHWEDWGRLPIDPLYNYATSGFEYRDFHKKAVRVDLKESPGHVLTSNFQQTYEDPSSGGRMLPTGFSHRFNRGDIRKNKPERKISFVMPGLRDKPEDMSSELRCQIAYLCAMGVQFCMRAGTRVLPPMEDLNYRSRVVSLGGRFIEWAESFFGKPHVLNCPIDMDTIFEEYRELCESSEDKRMKFSPGVFKEKIKEYCGDIGIVMLPDVCFSSETDRSKGYMRVKAWCKETFFDDEKVWGRGMKKEIRVLKHSSKCLFFCKESEIPEDREAVKQMCKTYYSQPDPDPITDGNGDLVVLTEEEKAKWDRYMIRKQGGMPPYSPVTPTSGTSAQQPNSPAVVPEDLPF